MLRALLCLRGQIPVLRRSSAFRVASKASRFYKGLLSIFIALDPSPTVSHSAVPRRSLTHCTRLWSPNGFTYMEEAQATLSLPGNESSSANDHYGFSKALEPSVSGVIA